jgi:ribosomal protein S11
MTVSWISSDFTDSFVHLTDAGGNVKVVKGTDKATTYTFQSAYEAAPYVSGFIHHVTVTDLTPASKYSYQCGTVIFSW